MKTSTSDEQKKNSNAKVVRVMIILVIVIFLFIAFIIAILSGVIAEHLSNMSKLLFLPVQSLAALLGTYIAWRIFCDKERSRTGREQLDKIYHPIFKIIEPHLYQNIERAYCDLLIDALKIKIETEENEEYLIDSKLRELIIRYETSGNCSEQERKRYRYKWEILRNKNESHLGYCYLTYWFRICAHIDRTHDRLCKASFLPTRSIAYRSYRNQYITSWRWAGSFLLLNWISVAFMMLSIVPSILYFWFSLHKN